MSTLACAEPFPVDLDVSLVEDPRFLADASFTGSLLASLEDERGAEGALKALLQLGFVHGLRDAAGAMDPSGLFGVQARVTPVRLAMRFAPRSGAARRGLLLRGHWPERLEAECRIGRGARSAAPACVASAGYTSGWLSGLFHTDVLAVEARCAAAGAARCLFVAREVETWSRRRFGPAQALLAHLPFEELRERAVAAGTSPPAEPAPESVFDPESPAVHVWGPVMVVPFAGVDETVRAVELIGREPGAQQVAVVVLNLAGTLVDEGFGSVALERVLDAIAAWGAEAILTGVSPLSERAVAGLAHPYLVVHKTLQEAIAAAFHIADALRCNV